MDDLISREWLLDVVENIIEWDTERDRRRAIHQVRELTPAVDAVEVVRCEDCRYCEGKFIKSDGETILRCWLWEKNLYSNGYCAWGQRREDGKA